MSNLIDINYRFVYNTPHGLLARYGDIVHYADTYNDIIGISYEKFKELSLYERIKLDVGDIKMDSFYVEDENNGNHKVPEKVYDNKLIDTHYKFKISLAWSYDKNKYVQPPPLLVRRNAGSGPFE